MKKTGSGFTYDIEGVATQPINKITAFKIILFNKYWINKYVYKVYIDTINTTF